MSKTIKELANELGISKQAVSKKLTANFRANHVTTVTTNCQPTNHQRCRQQR